MKNFGVGDASFQAAGCETGIRKLVEDFYDKMETLDVGRPIRAMHQGDIEVIKDKLTIFLTGWLGGPKKYREKYGPISIPRDHQHLDVSGKEKDAWLHCMREATKLQDYSDNFQEYLLIQLEVPAERIRQVSQMRQTGSSD